MSEETTKTPPKPLISGFLLAAVALTPAVFATAFTRYETVKFATFAALVGLACIVWGATVARGKSVSWHGFRPAAVGLAFSVFAILGIAWNDAPITGLYNAVLWSGLGMIVLMIAANADRAMTFSTFSIAVAAGAILSGVFGLLDVAGVSVFSSIWDAPGATGAFDGIGAVTAFYAVAIPILMGGVVVNDGVGRIVAGLGLAVSAFHFGHATELWLLLSILGVGLAIGLLAGKSFGKTALVAGAISLFIAMAGHFVLERPDPDATLANEHPLILKREIASAADLKSNKIQNFEFDVDRVEDLMPGARPHVATNAFALFRESPAIGYGTGSWWPRQSQYSISTEYTRPLFDHYPAFRSAHNAALTVLVELGAVGLALLAIFFAMVFGVGVPTVTRSEGRGRAESAMLLAAVSSGFVAAIFTQAFELVPFLLVWGISIGLLLRLSAGPLEMRGLGSVLSIQGGVGRALGVVALLLGLGFLAYGSVHTLAKYKQGHADLLMLRAKHTAATAAYKKAWDVFPAFAENPYNRALVLKWSSKAEESGELINQAVKLRPYDARYVHHLGVIQLKQNELTPALKSAKRSVELFENNVEARKMISLAFDLQGRMPEAAEQLVDLLALKPPARVRKEVHQNLGRYYTTLEKPHNAVEHYRKALELETSPIARRTIGGRLDAILAQIERDRLIREGKPIPPALQRKLDAEKNKHNHDHGLGGPSGMPKVPKVPGTHDEHDH